jgi:hypothetical protein
VLRKWTTDYESGIADIGSRFELTEADRPHPIRPQLKGRPRIYFVVADGQGELRVNESGVYTCVEAKDTAGLVNLRRQVVRYHFPDEEEGKPVGAMRPRKIDDDCVDILRAFATHRWPRRPPMTQRERDYRALPAHFRDDAIAKLPPEQASAAIMGARVFLHEREEERERERGGSRFSDFRPPRIPARPRSPWER